MEPKDQAITAKDGACQATHDTEQTARPFHQSLTDPLNALSNRSQDPRNAWSAGFVVMRELHDRAACGFPPATDSKSVVKGVLRSW